jgi:spermidine/putrescine transport system substrate-binding protein
MKKKEKMMKKYRGLFVTCLLLAVMLVSACGANSAPAEPAEPQAAPTEQPAAPTEPAAEATTAPESQAAPTESSDQSAASSGPAEGLDPELSVYNWADYIDEEVLKNYEKEYGVKISYDTYASNEDLLAKLQAGATGYDVIFPSDYMVAQMIELGLLAEIDHNNLPDLKNLDPFFTDPPFDPGLKHCIPYDWGTTGIAYSKNYFGDTPPDSWAYIYDPAKTQKFAEDKGVNILDDQREVIGEALKYLGYSLNDTDESHLQQAKELILKAKPYIKTFNSTDYDESLLVPHEVIISMAWSGDAAQAASKTIDEATGESDWAFAIPKEGAFIFVDNVCVTASTQRKATAEHFLNYLLDAKNSAAITNYTYYASANKAAEEFINKDILEDPSIYPPQEIKDKLELGKPLGEAVFLYDQIWTEIKSQ